MLTLLTISTVFIAVVLAVVHGRTVREILLWASAGIGCLSMLGALVAFLFAAIYWNGWLALIGVGLLAVTGIAQAIEEKDRDKQFAKFRDSFNKTKDSR